MPIARIAPRRVQTTESEDSTGVVTLFTVKPGKYPVLVKGVEEGFKGTYKSGKRFGKPYTATILTLELTIGTTKLDFPAYLFERSKAESSFIQVFDNDPSINSMTDTTGKTVTAVLDRNLGGFLNVVEFVRA